MIEHDEKVFCEKTVLELLETLTNRIELHDDFSKRKYEDKVVLSLAILINLLGNRVINATKDADLSTYEINARYVIDGIEGWFKQRLDTIREERTKKDEAIQ